MNKQFQQYISKHLEIDQSEKIVLTVSGGIDSMVMFHLFASYTQNITILHCNFMLRGKESDGDEEFVIQEANKAGISFFTKKFNTEEFAKENKISIQEAARELRYSWFEEKRRELNYDYIAIAHNKDDVIETFLFNLTRGTGLKGLTGIKAKQDNIIRPILFADRESIMQYANQNNIAYRDDSSNALTKYSRNKIRHLVAPILKEINPQYSNHIIDTIKYLSEVDQIMESYIGSLKNEIISTEKNTTKIDLSYIRDNLNFNSLLYYLLKDFNFNSSTVNDLIQSLPEQPGKRFLSESHEAILDRDFILIRKIQDKGSISYLIEKEYSELTEPFLIHIKKISDLETYNIPRTSNIACIDYGKLIFPLKLRKWKDGDKFIPLGMKGFKKLSNFFIDQKMSIFDKEEIFVLVNNNNEIIWIAGKRLDDRYKLTSETKTIYQIDATFN